jgi:hypothetical protein
MRIKKLNNMEHSTLVALLQLFTKITKEELLPSDALLATVKKNVMLGSKRK